ncbi:MAG: tRNA threonylcarbamoyladenosine dehydratase [Bacteroidales bacterium]|jgi:tRNA A37 threonylcarbamoyladenosine dehydratase|nr:tRNA threonylcarbamoyladenosine dehydratase [Bacteroidales bacterium]
MDRFFHRTELLLGKDISEKLISTKVIIFGVGGVGSWCAESLIRSGVENLTIVDSDRVCITNVNRQVMANSKTIGQIKTEALKNHLLLINPNAKINALQMIYSEENSGFFELEKYDYIIDAIDSIKNKVHLIQTATKTSAVLFSAMGAALKISPDKIKVAEFWKINGCPLSALLRKRFRKFGFPSKKFLCVYGEEILENRAENNTCGTAQCLCPKITGTNSDIAEHEWCSSKAIINGTIAHITAIFGFTLAGLIIENIYNQNQNMEQTGRFDNG